MDSNVLIGRVAASYFGSRLQDADPTATARYLLDSLSAEQTAAIARAIVADETLRTQIELKLPAQWLAEFGLPPECLTLERATFYRNAPCDKPILIIATPGDDERQSLADLTIIDSAQLRSHIELWVGAAAANLPLTDQHRRWWTVALTALLDVAPMTLERFSDYVLETQRQIEDGKVFLDALGEALPTLRWPRNPGIFRSLNQKTASYGSKWRALFQQVQKKQACYLRKYTPTNQLLSGDELNVSFEKVKDVIPDVYHDVIRAFIASPSKWGAEAEALARIEWETVKPLFDGIRPEPFRLGRATLEFFDDQREDALTTDEREYLETLADKRAKTSEPIPDDSEFYRRHRAELKADVQLKSRWDKFIFGAPIEARDFLLGIAAALESLFDQDIPEGAKRRLTITSDKRSKGDLKKLNVDAGRYFALRYRGLRDLLGSSTFDVGSLFEFDRIERDWAAAKARKYRPNTSTARAALEVKFYVILSIEDGAIETQRQVVWKFNPNAINSELFSDWERLTERPFTAGEVYREPVGAKGEPQPLDLRQVRSLSAAFGQDRGSLVPVHRRDRDIAETWKSNLASAASQGLISVEVRSDLEAAFEAFARSYRDAIIAFGSSSIATTGIDEQYRTYGELLDRVTQRAKGDRNRDLLLKPLLAIGVIPIFGGAPAAIVAPWNPLRLRATAAKARRMASLIRHLVTAPTVRFGDTTLFFKEVRDELEHPFYPEIVLGWRERKPELLTLTDTVLDYSVHELPVSDARGGDTNENSGAMATEIVDMIQRYLALFPHERANLSTVLYNCDAAGLPQTVVNRINEMHEEEDDMRCEVLLRHRDRSTLHKLYERILESNESEGDGFVAGEASREFMARLRIGIMADEAPVPNPKDGPRTDLVFLHNVIARRARIEWYREDAEPLDVSKLVPSRWSRRRPAASDDEKSVVYLCSPVQTFEGWAFVTAIAAHFRPDWDAELKHRYLPARQLDFHDPETSKIFEETHNLGTWVVNYDELLDRRQLVNQGVKVIRYKQSATQGRSLLVSSNAPLGLLQQMLHNRIHDLLPDMPSEDVRLLARRFIEDANRLSGDIVLRAAKRGRNASELMGVVLSQYLVRAELGDVRVGTYFLDDYSEWLGQDEARIADLLLLAPSVSPDGERRLTVVLSEAKYILEHSVAEKRRESQRQLRDTYVGVEQALFGDPERLDRDLWLARFSDLLLSGIPYAASDPIDLAAFRRALRDGQCRVTLRGYSHVFVSGPSDGSECSEFVRVAGCENSFQEVYSRAKTRALVLAYATNASPAAVRASVVESAELHTAPERPVSEVAPVLSTATTPFAAPVAAKAAPIVSPGTSSATHASAAPTALTPAHPIADTAAPGTTSASSSWLYPEISTVISEHAPPPHTSAEDAEWLRSVVNRMRAGLQQFQLNSKVVGEPRLTPNASIVRFQGAPNMTVELMSRRRSEFLTTNGLDLIAIKGEPGVVAVSIARPSRQVLHTLDVWRRWTPPEGGGNYRLLVGVREEDSDLLFVSPTDNAPHTLIAGMTGSGKSVLMQNVILSIAATNTPAQARIILIDPKLGVDYFAFEGLPHLENGIVEEQTNAIQVLNDLVTEMDRRYGVLKANRSANIFELNRKVGPADRLPCLWVIHDEFAEWMMTDHYHDTVSNVVSRLGVKARAAGIFLVFAAQRPDNNVMPMQLRSNLGNRLILRVDSEGTSEIALGGERGAERLLGRGHMLAKLEGHAGLVYAQVPMITSDDIRHIVTAIEQRMTGVTRQRP